MTRRSRTIRTRTTALAALALATAGCGGGPRAAESALTIVAIGDSVTSGYTPVAIEADANYPRFIAHDIRQDILNLGTPRITAVAALREELPKMRTGCSAVTVYLGINDVEAIFKKRGETVDQYDAAMKGIIDGAKDACPRARVFVATVVRNDDLDGAQRLNAKIQRIGNVTIVDLDADPRMHDRANFADDIHPNRRGQLAIADDFERAMAGEIPQTASR